MLSCIDFYFLGVNDTEAELKKVVECIGTNVVKRKKTTHFMKHNRN